MSLFASSFQDPSAGPSTLSAPTLGKAHKDGNKKRKRASAPFTGGGGTGSNRLQITESNFHKVMKKVEGGEVKEKGGEGFNMGSTAGAGEKKGNGGKKVEMKGKGARGRAEANASGSGGQGPPAKKSKAKEAAEKKQPEVQREEKRTEDGKPAPAELPLPHNTPKSGKKGKSGDSSLTDMQKGMQAKLEGARFRYVQLSQARYSRGRS